MILTENRGGVIHETVDLKTAVSEIQLLAKMMREATFEGEPSPEFRETCWALRHAAVALKEAAQKALGIPL